MINLLLKFHCLFLFAVQFPDKIVYIVENGEAQVDSSGGLLLSPVLPQSGSGLLGADDLGSGGRIQRSLTQFSSSSVQALPPLPADVDDVEFTWFSTATVCYFSANFNSRLYAFVLFLVMHHTY